MGRFTRFLLIPVFGWLSFFIPAAAAAHNLTLTGATSCEDLAFAQYIASLREPDPFGTETVAVTIEAWSPCLHQESRLVRAGAPGRPAVIFQSDHSGEL